LRFTSASFWRHDPRAETPHFRTGRGPDEDRDTPRVAAAAGGGPVLMKVRAIDAVAALAPQPKPSAGVRETRRRSAITCLKSTGLVQ
jgi:hypothetical protein